MKIELNKLYKTKSGKIIKIKRFSLDIYWGELQDDSRRMVKYDETGKVPGWALGNFLDIVSEINEEAEKNAKD